MDIADYAWLTAAVYIVSMSISLVEMLLLTVVKKEEAFFHAYGAPRRRENTRKGWDE